MYDWIWAVLLLVLGLGLAVLEVFFPSAGVIGFLATAATIGAVVMGFREGPGTGVAILATAVAGVPVVLALALKIWPKTAVGRRVLLMAPKSEDVLPASSRRQKLQELIGEIAVAKTKMLPSGAIAIKGRTIAAVSQGMPIEAGQRVRVVEARANRVVVRPLDDETPSETAEDPLRRPIDSVAADPFGEPPA